MSSAATLRISADGTAASIGVMGAGLHDLAIGGREVIPTDTPIARTKWFHGLALAPWVNRLRNGTWSLQGTEYSAPLNDPFGNALHGLVGRRLFHVVQHDASSIRLEHLLGEDDAYPWPVRITLTYSVHADGITCSIGARNESDLRLPVALGVHPYLAFDDDCSITITATSMYENDAQSIPTGVRSSPVIVGVTPGHPTPLADVALDDCFTDLSRDASGIAHTVITYGDGATADVWQDASLTHVQVFTLRDFPWARARAHGVAIEPQSAPANAFQTGEGLRWLDPGEAWTAHWGIQFAPRERAGSK